ILVGATSALANTYNLVSFDPGSGLVPIGGKFGTVVTEQVGNNIRITVDLDPDSAFRFNQNNNVNHHALVFESNGSLLVDLVSLSPAYFTFLGAGVPPDWQESPFGNEWDYGVNCSGCGGGFAGGQV